MDIYFVILFSIMGILFTIVGLPIIVSFWFLITDSNKSFDKHVRGDFAIMGIMVDAEGQKSEELNRVRVFKYFWGWVRLGLLIKQIPYYWTPKNKERQIQVYLKFIAKRLEHLNTEEEEITKKINTMGVTSNKQIKFHVKWSNLRVRIWNKQKRVKTQFDLIVKLAYNIGFEVDLEKKPLTYLE